MKKKIDFSACEENKRRIDAMRPFPLQTLKSLRDYYRVGLTYSSNAIEGNSLTESETKIVLEDGLTIHGKPLRDIYEAIGHAKAYDYMHELVQCRELCESDIAQLHKMFYSQIDSKAAGKYRTMKVFISGSRHAVSAPEEISEKMHAFVDWFNREEQNLHPIEFAAETHRKFVFIHPFVDGNGRLARLLMNLSLMRAGYPTTIIPPILRSEYVSRLEKAHRDKNPFILFIRDCVCETQNEILRLMGKMGVKNSGGVNGGVKGGVKFGIDDVFTLIRSTPGMNTSGLIEKSALPRRTLERYLHRLVFDKRIIFKGAPKTGGYYEI